MNEELIQIILEDVIEFQNSIATELGTTAGISSMALLASAVNAPFQSVFGQDAYPTVYEKAARLAFGIINNHAFIDGNKRAGIHAMELFLLINDIYLDNTNVADIAVAIAEKNLEIPEITTWIKDHLI